MNALRKDEFIKKFVYFCYLDQSVPTDITQVVDGTTVVISKDVKMRMISNRIQPKSLSYPKNDFLDKQAKDGIKKRSCLRDG